MLFFTIACLTAYFGYWILERIILYERTQATMNNGNFAAQKPYPPTDAVSENPRAARSLFALRDGELEAISEYIYQSIIFGEVYPKLATLLEGIAMTEMKHYRLLSETIQALGSNPSVNSRVRTSLIDISSDTPSMAPYAARRTLKANIADENAAAKSYREAAAHTDDEALSAILIRIAEDEELHAVLLNGALNSIKTG